MSKKNARKQKKSKARRAAQQQRKTTYDPKVPTKYARKKALQAKGEYSPNSPFRVVNHISAISA